MLLASFPTLVAAILPPGIDLERNAACSATPAASLASYLPIAAATAAGITAAVGFAYFFALIFRSHSKKS